MTKHPELENILQRAQEIVNEQAEDMALWCHALTATEAYLQKGLRHLHAVIEGDQVMEAFYLKDHEDETSGSILL